MSPAISILTPVWNGVPYIRECVESVLAQDFSEWEMLISDNGSTDGTREYLRTLNDARIRTFYQEENLGIFGNLNFLFEHAYSPISQILCADDCFIDAASLSMIVGLWNRLDPIHGLVRINQRTSSNNEVNRYFTEHVPEHIPPEKTDLYFYLFGCIAGNLSNMSLRTEIVKEEGGFRLDLPYAGDFEFWSRASRKRGLLIVPDELIYVRRHPGVASNYLNARGDLFPQVATITNELFKRCVGAQPDAAFWLKVAGTLNYDSFSRLVAFRIDPTGSKGMWDKIKTASQQVDYLIAHRLLFLLSLGGKLFRLYAIKKVMQKTQSAF